MGEGGWWSWEGRVGLRRLAMGEGGGGKQFGPLPSCTQPPHVGPCFQPPLWAEDSVGLHRVSLKPLNYRVIPGQNHVGRGRTDATCTGYRASTPNTPLLRQRDLVPTPGHAEANPFGNVFRSELYLIFTRSGHWKVTSRCL